MVITFHGQAICNNVKIGENIINMERKSGRTNWKVLETINVGSSFVAY